MTGEGAVVRLSCLSPSLMEVVRSPGVLQSQEDCGRLPNASFRDIENQMTVLRRRLRNAK